MNNSCEFDIKKDLKNFISNHSSYEKMENFNKNVSSLITEIKETNGKIAIISDFDYTLTKRFDLNNDQITFFSSYGVLENFKDLTQNYKKKTKDLFAHYHKYESDFSIDEETRKKLVLKWYTENLELILEENITKSHFQEMFDQSEKYFFFRSGIIELFEIILEYKIPLFIVSGGLYDIIEHALKAIIPFYKLLQEEKLIKIIANQFIFDEKTDKIVGFHQPLVYAFNKAEIIKNHFEKYQSNIENIILLGDHVNDVDSGKGLDVKTSIKIGFMNSKNLLDKADDFQLYEVFVKHYDIGIWNDATLNFVNHILYDIFSNTKKSEEINTNNAD